MVGARRPDLFAFFTVVQLRDVKIVGIHVELQGEAAGCGDLVEGELQVDVAGVDEDAATLVEEGEQQGETYEDVKYDDSWCKVRQAIKPSNITIVCPSFEQKRPKHRNDR